MNDELIRLAIKLSECGTNYGEDDVEMWADLDKLGKLARAAQQQSAVVPMKTPPHCPSCSCGMEIDWKRRYEDLLASRDMP